MSYKLKTYLDNLNADAFCCRNCKVKHMNRMYEYMLSAETKNIILRPRFASFRVALMTKSDELRMEAEKHKGRMGLLCTDSQVELDEEYGKLVLNTIKLMMFWKTTAFPVSM